MRPMCGVIKHARTGSNAWSAKDTTRPHFGNARNHAEDWNLAKSRSWATSGEDLFQHEGIFRLGGPTRGHDRQAVTVTVLPKFRCGGTTVLTMPFYG
jgi:hypothetical protein